MTQQKNRKAAPPLDQDSLQRMALRYVERYATSEMKLTRYLVRKVRERGWNGEKPADIEAIVTKFSALRYVDDASYAETQARSLTRRGYGARRVGQKLQAAGINEAMRVNITESVDARDAAMIYARRRRFGPFSSQPMTRELRAKQFAAMMRAGHDARTVAELLDAQSEIDFTDFE